MPRCLDAWEPRTTHPDHHQQQQQQQQPHQILSQIEDNVNNENII
jgi:hypothetical protein